MVGATSAYPRLRVDVLYHVRVQRLPPSRPLMIPSSHGPGRYTCLRGRANLIGGGRAGPGPARGPPGRAPARRGPRPGRDSEEARVRVDGQRCGVGWTWPGSRLGPEPATAFVWWQEKK